MSTSSSSEKALYGLPTKLQQDVNAILKSFWHNLPDYEKRNHEFIDFDVDLILKTHLSPRPHSRPVEHTSPASHYIPTRNYAQIEESYSFRDKVDSVIQALFRVVLD